MFEASLSLKAKKVLDEIQTEAFIKDYYLAGGTALALQIGHRISVDLDFFTTTLIPLAHLNQDLMNFHPIISKQTEGSMDVYIHDVKVSFFSYPYPMIKPFVPYRSIDLADQLDIACMKINAIASRGSKKDFVDLYFLLMENSLDEILALFDIKYAGISYQKLHLLKSLVYFQDAENDPEPDYLTPVNWKTIKATIHEVVMKSTY